jgi:hypothetical protein
MAVLIPNASLGVRRYTHPEARDARGKPKGGGALGSLEGPWPGFCAEGDTDNQWSFRLDPAAWPLNDGDHITDGSRTWVITAARPHFNALASDADYVGATAQLSPPKVP